MLFNSPEFIFCFLPLTLALYFYLGHIGFFEAAKVLLLLSSLVFYTWWNPSFLPLFVTSILLNYGLSRLMNRSSDKQLRKKVLIVAVTANLLFLAYFKYRNFFVENLNDFFVENIPLIDLVLPLAISFFTLQQIAFQVESYKNEVHPHSFIEYALFVAFFPQLIAGPIVSQKLIMPQIQDKKSKILNFDNLGLGVHLLLLGLCKKIFLADNFGAWANIGFDDIENPLFLSTWIASLCFTLQIYFDFSGYTDMALGIGRMFNIQLPINFNSPYKALNLIEFWRTWHITLSKFLRNYVYIPLGGNKRGEIRKYGNMVFTMVLCGFWHGAAWTFVIYGFLHGMGLLIVNFWRHYKVPIHPVFAWSLTFTFVVFARVLFRAQDMSSAISLYKSAINFEGIHVDTIMHQLQILSNSDFRVGIIFMIGMLVLGMLVVLLLPNTNSVLEDYQPNRRSMLVASCAGLLAFVYSGKAHQFLYFNF